MADMLSPGVFVREVDASLTTPQVSSSTAVFAGNFLKGPVGTYLVISDRKMLAEYYGLPNKYNYNDWYQCANYLDYGKTLYVSRAASLTGSIIPTTSYINTAGKEANIIPDYFTPTDLFVTSVDGSTIKVRVQGPDSNININDFIIFGEDLKKSYKVLSIEEVDNGIGFNLTLEVGDSTLEPDILIGKKVKIKTFSQKVEGNWLRLEGKNIDIKQGEIITFGENTTDARYRVLEVIKFPNTDGDILANIKFKYLESETAENELDGTKKDLSKMLGKLVKRVLLVRSATAEIPSIRGSFIKPIDYEEYEHLVLNTGHWQDVYDSLAFVSENSKLKFYARTPGSHGNNVKIAIAKYEDFGKSKELAPGIALDTLFEYKPAKDEICVCIFNGGSLQEKYIVSFDPKAKDYSNKSTYIENVINSKSDLVYVKFNGNEDPIRSCLGLDIISLTNGTSSNPSNADIREAYNIFDNKEEVDVDLIIANEQDPHAAINLVETRKDCIGFVGCPYEASVGLKSAYAVKENVKFRNDLNVDSSYITLCGNYKYQYCPELGTNKWVNLAGDVAGLKAQSNSDTALWFAAAGANRGKIKNVIKLAYNPVQAQRDVLYVSSINPVVIFSGQGPVLWGQKTLQSKPSAFDRVNVRALFNYIERTLARMSKYSLFEFNDAFTRNNLVATMRPFLTRVQAGRGIQDFMVICDESNNTPNVVSQNQLICDIYIKPTYVAEFIRLTFVNAGTNDFSTVIGVVG